MYCVRCNNHAATFRNEIKQKSTELWELNESNIQYHFSWDLASRTYPYNGCTRKCDVCLPEKLTVAKRDTSPLLNTRDEFISKCRHINKCFLKCFKMASLSQRSRDKLKLLRFHFQSVCGHQTWYDGYLTRGLLTIKSFNALITWSCKVT